jgi:hypothetical protein
VEVQVKPSEKRVNEQPLLALLPSPTLLFVDQRASTYEPEPPSFFHYYSRSKVPSCVKKSYNLFFPLFAVLFEKVIA